MALRVVKSGVGIVAIVGVDRRAKRNIEGNPIHGERVAIVGVVHGESCNIMTRYRAAHVSHAIDVEGGPDMIDCRPAYVLHEDSPTMIYCRPAHVLHEDGIEGSSTHSEGVAIVGAGHGESCDIESNSCA